MEREKVEAWMLHVAPVVWGQMARMDSASGKGVGSDESPSFEAIFPLTTHNALSAISIEVY